MPTNPNWNSVLPTLLPDGREVDVRYSHLPASRAHWQGDHLCPAEPADVALWAVIDLADRDITLELAPEVRAALEDECRADAGCPLNNPVVLR